MREHKPGTHLRFHGSRFTHHAPPSSIQHRVSSICRHVSRITFHAFHKRIARRGQLRAGASEFGAAFEHFIWMELRAHASYSRLHYPIAYWRTASGFEVDFVIADGAAAIEAKSTDQPTTDHLKGLRALKDELHPPRCVLVSRVPRPRRTSDGIEILPWRDFHPQLLIGNCLFDARRVISSNVPAVYDVHRRRMWL
jgi:hypothetical protein